MKIIFSALLAICSLYTYAQDCETLNNFNSYRGIRFGNPIPSKLSNVFTKEKTLADWVTYSLEKHNADQIDKDSLWRYFYLGDLFSSISVSTTKDKVFNIVLFKAFSKKDSAELLNNQYPSFYNKVANELASMFGTDYQTRDTVNWMGVSEEIRVWECDKMIITFGLTRDRFMLDITDKIMERKWRVSKYASF